MIVSLNFHGLLFRGKDFKSLFKLKTNVSPKLSTVQALINPINSF